MDRRQAVQILLKGVLGGALPAACGLAVPARAEGASSFDGLVMALAPPPSGEALAQIPDPGRKLLALRSYLRFGKGLADRWSWTAAEVKAFEGSAEHTALLAAIAAVNAHFKAANPGFELYVHATVRSLDEQIAKWNANESVGVGGAEILKAFTAALGQPAAEPSAAQAAKAGAWLRAFQPGKRANLAAPGLTLHGRASAIDFQVMQNGAIHAGASEKQVESVWKAEGWDVKLKASIAAAGPAFSGPLANPDEPWHYDYAAKTPPG